MVKGQCHCGLSGWTLMDELVSATACNCTLCRRYGALWAYGYEDSGASLHGSTIIYTRARPDPALELHFCGACGGVTGYRSLRIEEGGKRKIAVNLRLASPEVVADLAVEHFDGLVSFEDRPADGCRVRDLWF